MDTIEISNIPGLMLLGDLTICEDITYQRNRLAWRSPFSMKWISTVEFHASDDWREAACLSIDALLRRYKLEPFRFEVLKALIRKAKP